MTKYTIEFYRQEDGTEPAKDFIENLPPKMIAKILKVVELLERNGPLVRMPYSEHLEDGIFEIRAKQGCDIVRVLYFFIADKKIILANGFVKKTNKTPKREMKKAKKFRRDYERRQKS